MDLEKLEKLVNLVLPELLNLIEKGYGSYPLYSYSATEAKFRNLLSVASITLPEHVELFKNAYSKIGFMQYSISLSVTAAKMLLEHLLEIIQIEKASEMKIKDMKIFESVEEKLKQAGVSFRKDDYTSVLHNLNTCLELVLKDKVGIPTTISSINTSTIIDIWVKEKMESYLYLAEVKKHVLAIDNKIKHQGYSPSKTECINAIASMESLVSRLKDKKIEITDEIKEEIFEGL